MKIPELIPGTNDKDRKEASHQSALYIITTKCTPDLYISRTLFHAGAKSTKMDLTPGEKAHSFATFQNSMFLCPLIIIHSLLI